jgi:hypothetical protein
MEYNDVPVTRHPSDFCLAQADTPTVAAVPFERRGSAGSKLVSKLKPSSSDDAEEREPLLANKGAVDGDVVAPPAPQVPAAQRRPTSRPTSAPTAVQTAVANALRPFQAGFR